MTSPASSAPQVLRLAYLVSRYPAVSHTFIQREVEALRRLGATVHVASVNSPDRPVERMTDTERTEALNTYCLKAAGWTAALGAGIHCLVKHPRGLVRALHASLGLGRGAQRLYGLFYLAEAAMVVHWMASKQLQHLHVHFATAGATVGMLVRTLAPVGLSLTIHGPDEFDDVPGQHLRAKLQAADMVVCISQFARSQLMRLSPQTLWDKLRVCHLGVPAPSGANTVQTRIPGSAPRLLCVGRLAPAKGQHVLLHACALLRARGLRFRLTLVGDGEDRQSLQDTCQQFGLEDCVIFAGALNQTEVRETMLQSDIFVLPSMAEGIPVVLMEAMALGLPVVSSPVNGIPELISDQHNGLLAAPGDAYALAERLTHLLCDAKLRQTLGAAGRQTVRRRFDLDTNVAMLAHLFTDMPQACTQAPAHHLHVQEAV